MSTIKGRAAFFLALSVLAITISACESSERHEGTAPVVITSPSPTTTIAPTTSPTAGQTVTLSTFDKDFLTKAAQGNMAEVRLGNLAAEKASSNDVKRFAQRMVTDHTQAGQQLNQLATTLNFTPPQDLNPEQQNAISRLETASGKDFDREYMKMMVDDHRKDISEFERAAAQATNPDVKQFASQLLPTLNEHAKLAHEISAKVGGKRPEGR